MTTTTSPQEIEEQTAPTTITPERPGGVAHSGGSAVLGFLHRFWRDQLYLERRLLAAQRLWEDANPRGW